jgi:hypothetical protein
VGGGQRRFDYSGGFRGAHGSRRQWPLLTV